VCNWQAWNKSTVTEAVHVVDQGTAQGLTLRVVLLCGPQQQLTLNGGQLHWILYIFLQVTRHLPSISLP
jgi:hypothetical protein